MAGEWRNYSRRFARVLKVTGGGRGDEEGKFVLTARFIVFPSRIGAASSSSSEELLITLDIRRVMRTGLRIRCRWFHQTFKLEFAWKRNKYRDLHSHKYCDLEQLLILNYLASSWHQPSICDLNISWFSSNPKLCVKSFHQLLQISKQFFCVFSTRVSQASNQMKNVDQQNQFTNFLSNYRT